VRPVQDHQARQAEEIWQDKKEDPDGHL